MGIINQLFKRPWYKSPPELEFTEHWPNLCYGSEAWTVRHIDIQGLIVSEMHTAGYMKKSHIRNYDIMKELQISC